MDYGSRGKLYPIRKYFEIFYSNRAINRLVSEICANSSVYTERLDSDQLAYVTCIAYLNRIFQCAINYGYYLDIPEASYVKQVATSILLPKTLAKYIECIGLVNLSNGAETVPWVGSRAEIFASNLEQISPRDILVRAGREIPENHWWIDSEWIVDWNITNAFFNNRRRVDNNNFNGRIESLVTPIISKETFTPTVPQKITISQAIDGSIYEWRNFNQADIWPGHTKMICLHLFSAMEFHARVHHDHIFTM